MRTIKILLILAVYFMFFNLASVEINELKSAYIEKFTRFIEWSDNESHEKFVIGYINPDEFTDDLREFFSDNKIKNKKVEFKRIKSISDTNGCNIIYIPKIKSTFTDRIIQKCKHSPILLVSHSDSYGHYVHLNFYVDENRLKFESNPDAFRESGLKVSYHLLRLSRIVSSK